MASAARSGVTEASKHRADRAGSTTTWGQLLRRYRGQARLTQEELAERSGYSADYIGKLERDQRRPPLVTVDRLAAVLELGDRERAELLAARERHGPAPPAVRPPTPSPLPTPPTPLIGRVAERAAVHVALGASRLVTLTGVGGTGKTRLALEVAREAAVDGDFADGVAFVDGAPLRTPSLLAPAVTRALGLVDQPSLPPEIHLIQALQPRHLLLVVDNLEHLLDEAPFLSRLVASTPRLYVLVTSRVPLHLYGEHEIRVPPLALPPSDAEPGSPDLVASEAVQLFIARARAVAPGFIPTGTTLSAVAAICVALDGLPLAIELAAGRVTLFPPEALLPRLGDRLALLTGGPRDLPHRQQTLRATLDWSYALLTAAERALFANLGVFAGSFDATAAAVVCSPEGWLRPAGIVPDLGPEVDARSDQMLLELAGLADQSLVEVVPGLMPRFRLLATVRAYALARLAEDGIPEVILDQHLRYYRRLAERASAALTGPEQGASLARLDEEHDNLRAALGWARERGAVEEGLRLAGALGRFWRLRGHLREGLGWLESLLVMPTDAPDAAARVARAQALNSAGVLAWRLGEYVQAASMLTEALALCREVGDSHGAAETLNSLGNVAYRQGDDAQAATLYAEALALWREAEYTRGISVALGNLGRASFQLGDDARALHLLEETLVLKRRLGDTRGVAGTLNSLGRIAIRQGDHARASALLEESLELKRTLGDQVGRVTSLSLLGWGAFRQGDTARAQVLLVEALRLGQEVGAWDRVPEVLESLAVVAAADGRPRDAARVGGVAARLRATLGLPLSLDQQSSHGEMIQMARAALGEDEFAAMWAAGEAQPLEETITEALEQADSD